MYSRAYSKVSDEGVLIPERYGGTVFSEPIREERASYSEVSAIPAGTATKEAKISPQIEADNEAATENSEQSQPVFSFSKSVIAPFFKGLIPRSRHIKREFPVLELEDLLIIGISLFLLISPSGDRELGLMLALLVFIG